MISQSKVLSVKWQHKCTTCSCTSALYLPQAKCFIEGCIKKIHSAFYQCFTIQKHGAEHFSNNNPDAAACAKSHHKLATKSCSRSEILGSKQSISWVSHSKLGHCNPSMSAHMVMTRVMTLGWIEKNRNGLGGKSKEHLCSEKK